MREAQKVWLLLCLGFWSCGAVESLWATPKLQVVATFSILGDFVHNVGGDTIRLHVLVGPGEDTHTFEPSPADSVIMAKADLIFENGLAFETWFDKIYASSGSKAKRVVVTKGLKLLTLTGEPGQEKDHEHSAEQESGYAPETKQRGRHEQTSAPKPDPAHAHGEFDPHVWLDVQNVIHMVENIRQALIETDPANRAIYTTNAERYIAALQELDSWILAQVKTVPETRRKLITSHKTFGYFARRYGFEVVATVLGSMTDVADPSAGEIARLVETIRATGVPAIFAETIANPRLMGRIAAEAGVTLAPPLYTDALGKPGSEGETYLKLMRYNVTTIIKALQS